LRVTRLGPAALPLAFLAVLVALSSCASEPPKPVPARVRLVASADVNPDASGRPSPVVVRIFQLREDGEFVSADFFPLYENEKEVLGGSLVSRQEYVLQPGETRDIELPLAAGARYLGAIAAFRDIRSAKWRVVSSAPEKTLTDLFRRDRVTISVERQALELAVRD